LGSGKSEIAVIDFCQYVRIPNFIGVITRRTTPMLKGAGGIHTKCKRTFAKEFKDDPDYTYQWKEKDNKFVFYRKEKDSTGKIKLKEVSQLYLKHSEHEADTENIWQSVEANLICIDEATQYSSIIVDYIMSRMRNPSCPEVKPKIKMTCNPMYNHFLRKWVEPYLKEDGTPDRSKDGLIRYFARVNGEFLFGDTKKELMDLTGEEEGNILSFTFISATVDDNKILQKIDKRYVAWLKGLKGVDRQRLLEGNWYAKEEGDSYFLRKWITELDQAPDHTQFTKIVRAYDFAGTLPSDTNPNPDYTVSVKMGKLKTGEYVILEVLRTRIRFGDWEQHILENADRDGKRVEIIIPQDPNPMAKANSVRLATTICGYGYTCNTKRSAEGKLESFKPFAACAQNGSIFAVKDCGTDLFNKQFNTLEFAYQEMEVFTGRRSNRKDGHDDVADAMSLAYLYLGSSFILPSNFIKTLQDTSLSVSNPLLNVRGAN